MRQFNVVIEAKDGSRQYVSFQAKDRDDARRVAERLIFQREQRFQLTFDRLEQARETGEAGMLAVDPRLQGKALTEAWVKGELERRKRDQARYEAGLSVKKVEEAK